MDKCRILIPEMCRSTEALTKPIIERLWKEKWCSCYPFGIEPNDIPANYYETETIIKEYKPDLIFIVGDRVEAMSVAQCAFLNNIPICHYGSGITNYPPSCYDDFVRHQIAIVSNILLCEDQNSYERMCNIVSILRLNDKEIHRVGNLYLDDLELDFSLCPSEPYDLVLINAETLNPKDFNVDNIELYRYTIFIGSNPDKNLVNYNYNFKKLGFSEDKYYDNLPRNQYLGLLSKCKRFISNSSSIYYESPLYLKPVQIIHVGLRNLNRSTNFEEMKKYPNTANKIITILKEWWLKNGKEE